MTISRRQFLDWVVKGAATAVIAVHVPLQLTWGDVRKESAIQYLIKEYNAVTKGKGIAGQPRGLIVGKQLYDQVNRELTSYDMWENGEMARAGYSSRAFKGATLTYFGNGWGIKEWVYGNVVARVNKLHGVVNVHV